MDFEVQILGSNSALAAHGRHPTAQLVRHGGRLFLVDCGEGTQMLLQKYKSKPFRINHIFISHLHGDHYFGLIGLLTTFHLLQRKTPLTIFGPKALEPIIKLQLEVANTQLNYDLHFRHTQDEVTELIHEDEQFTIHSIPLRHRIPTTGFIFREKPHLRKINAEKTAALSLKPEDYDALRHGKDIIDQGGLHHSCESLTLPGPAPRTYAYCSDTIYNPDIIPEIASVDLLYHEATFMHECIERAGQTHHSTTTQAAQIAKDAQVKRLIIGHFSSKYTDLRPLLDEARSVFRHTELALEGKVFRIE